MRHRGRRRGRIIPALAACFAAGGVTGWLMRAEWMPPAVAAPSETIEQSVDHANDPVPEVPLESRSNDAPRRGVPDLIAELRTRHLQMPIEQANPAAMRGQFDSPRSQGERAHEAVDILAPRGTPIHAVEDGTIAKLFLSRAGGLTIYEFDPSKRFCYYYAHLDRYADNLHEGEPIRANQIIGYVGTSGNAPAHTPHLHFAVFELGPEREWWKGQPLDPYLIFH